MFVITSTSRVYVLLVGRVAARVVVVTDVVLGNAASIETSELVGATGSCNGMT